MCHCTTPRALNGLPRSRHGAPNHAVPRAARRGLARRTDCVGASLLPPLAWGNESNRNGADRHQPLTLFANPNRLATDRGRRGGALRGAALCSTEAHRDADKETAEGFKALSGMGGESKEVEMEPGTPSKVRSRCVSVPRCISVCLPLPLAPSLSVCLALGLPPCLCLSPPPCVSSPTLSVVCVCRRRGRRRRKFHRPPRKRPSCSRPPPR